MIDPSPPSSTPLERQLVEMITRNLLTREPRSVIDELRAAAGDDVETLAKVCGEVAGFCRDERTSTMCDALTTEIQGAAVWAEKGRQRRARATKYSAADE
ncbi:hypothetical protein IFU40_12155 [Microbacterium sp. CFBP 13617]|uniref:hypothetical protein n=1 Tax=Microbacterium sp. CFBP 13617 TaxID=2774035 RepID=UPI0017839803|nr:hypothetical protein [Microbacterium sp. CFBP 13617]MBD8219385.1 hypothetical protein [Microbacterium sp. CFBP 13617]